MWGNLRNTIATAGESGGIIAKLGDVVAPQSHDEDDEYEYEDEEESEEGEEEEYEYYDDEGETEDLNDIGEEALILNEDDDSGIDYSVGNVGSNEDGLEYEEDGTGIHTNQLQFSPSRLNDGLNGGRVAMGKLFGGVLQKGKEKLSETARNLVEPELNHLDNPDEQHPLEGEGAELNCVDDIFVEQQQQQYSHSDEDEPVVVETDSASDNNPPDAITDFDQGQVLSGNEIEKSELVIDSIDEDIGLMNEVSLSSKDEVLITDPNDIEEDKVADVALTHNENDSLPVVQGDDNDATGGDDDDDDDIHEDVQNEQNVPDLTEQESAEFYSFDDVPYSKSNDGMDTLNTGEDADELNNFVETKQSKIVDKSTQDNDVDSYVESRDDPDNTNDFKEELTASVSEQTTDENNNAIIAEEQKEYPIQVEKESINVLEQSNKRLLPFEGDVMMENGNDPAAIEILDETVGHAFNLQETGLDKTIGHHLTGQHGSLLVESELNETLGHHVSTSFLEENEVEDEDNVEINNSEELKTETQKPQPQPVAAEIQSTSVPSSSTPPTQVDEEKVRLVEAALAESNQKVEEYREKNFALEAEFISAQKAIKDLEKKLIQNEESHENILREMKANFDEDKELLVTTAQETHAEEVQQAVKKVRGDMEKYILDLQEEMAQQMEQSDQQLEQFRSMYEEARSQADKIQTNSKRELAKHNHQLAEMEKRHSISLERVENKAGRAMSALEDKDAQIKELNTIIRDMKNTIKQNVEEHEAVEDEADELHQENEELKEKMQLMVEEQKKVQNELNKMKEEHGKSLGVQIELQLLREERDREKEKLESLKETQNSNESTLISERDAAKANALDLEQRLTALNADLDLVKSDYERSIMANSNLQSAMEAFQIEREAELALLEESRVSAEEAIKASNDLALQSLKQENEASMKEVQLASSRAIENMMSEMALTEQKLEEYRRETINLRRSLDEAIHRLQTNQEDVIDRSLMKNIFLDWHSKSGKSRRDVMIVVASVLHFTEADKDKCGIGVGSSTINKVVGAVAPPLTPAAKTVDELDGDNIREKWVNFLIAESGDSPKNEKPPTKTRKSRQNKSGVVEL